MGPKAIIGLGADIIGGIYGNQARRREADRAFKRSKQMFDYQNKYNTPARQMERLKSAGLNPALMYGKGTTGNAEGYTQQAPAQQLNVAGAQSLMSGAQLGLISAQTKKLEADANKSNKEAGLTFQNTLGVIIDNQIKDATKAFKIKEASEKLNQARFITKQEEAKKVIMQWEAELSAQNVKPGDSLYKRLYAEFYNSISDKVKAFFEDPGILFHTDEEIIKEGKPILKRKHKNHNYMGTNPFNKVKLKD